MTDKQDRNRTISCTMQPSFFEWLRDHPVSLAVTTYQAGKLLFVGWNGTTVSLHAKNFSKAMGLDLQDGALALATLDEVQLYSNDALLAPDCHPAKPNCYDALFLPRASYFTGNLFAHDLFFADDEIWFVNTRFSCLATLSDRHNFVPRWQPPFISELAPEDRCHLNGLAIRDGVPQTVTALGATNTPQGWRETKESGGIVIDVPSGDIMLDGLAMPHSPRWYDGKLWVLNSGKGELLRVTGQNTADIVCKLPAYLRGLAFYKNFAVIGLCKIREKKTFGGMPIEAQVKQLLCGIAVVDVNSGECLGIFEFTDGVDEIYDIRILEGIRQPNLFLWGEDGAAGAVTAPEFSYWIRQTPEATNSGV